MVADKRIPWQRISVEAAAIVVSILLAFGIDAWWESERERDLAASYVDRLRSDIEHDLEAYRLTVAWSAAIDASSLYVLDVYRGRELSTEQYDEFAYHLFRTSWNMRGRTTSATYEDLIGTGNFGLLPLAVRNEITEYQVQKELYVEERAGSYAESAREGYWRVPDITLGPEIGPRVWESIQGTPPDFLPEVGSLKLSGTDIAGIVDALRGIEGLETQIAEVRNQMAQRKVLFGERMPAAAHNLLDVLAADEAKN